MHYPFKIKTSSTSSAISKNREIRVNDNQFPKSPTQRRGEPIEIRRLCFPPGRLSAQHLSAPERSSFENDTHGRPESDHTKLSIPHFRSALLYAQLQRLLAKEKRLALPSTLAGFSSVRRVLFCIQLHAPPMIFTGGARKLSHTSTSRGRCNARSGSPLPRVVCPCPHGADTTLGKVDFNDTHLFRQVFLFKDVIIKWESCPFVSKPSRDWVLAAPQTQQDVWLVF